MDLSLNEKIKKLKEEKNAIIVAHYYQRDEVQAVADAVGDSYYLSKVAKDCSEQVIVFCGVKFMAESAKILSPEKTVLLPTLDAGCPMADMAEAEDVLKLKSKYPNAKVVCYINSSAEVKAVSDVCCTSSNAIKIVSSLPDKDIIFVPDKNLGAYVQEQLPDKNIILWNGFCITHKKVSAAEVLKSKEVHKDIKVLVHPECEKEVRDLADFLGSTGEIIEYVNKSSDKKFLIVTEEGVLYELKNKNTDKQFFTPYGSMCCVNMKKTRLEDVYDSLNNMQYEINLDEEIRTKAYNSLMTMHKLGR